MASSNTGKNVRWVALDHGYWGCKLHLSFDQGKTWNEIVAPMYPEDEEISQGVAGTLKYI